MKDLTKGSPGRLMLSFALPIGLGNLFQLGYSLADTKIVGSVLGADALAAVGATSAVSSFLVSFLMGLSNGFAIISAQSFGAKDEKKLRQAAAGTLLLGGIITACLYVLMLGGRSFLLRLLQVPESLYGDASGYLTIIVLGTVVTLLYNAAAAILRSVGDTIAPLLFLMIAALLNIGLDILFMVVVPLGVRGAALGTVLAQGVSVVLCLVYIWKKYPVFHLKKEDFYLKAAMVKNMLGSGISMALMLSLVSFGTLTLQSAINTFGKETIVAHTAARKVCELFFLPFVVMGTTVSTFCGQNFGAGLYGRVRQGLFRAIEVAAVWSVMIILISYTIGKWMLQGITSTTDPAVIDTAMAYLKINAPFFFIAGNISILRHSLQALGHHMVPIVSSTIELVGKVCIALWLTPILKYMGVIIAEPIIWILMVIPLVVQILREPELRKSV